MLRRIPYEIVALSAIFGLAGALLFDPLTGFFLLAGGLFSALSFLWLKSALGKVLNQAKARALKAGIALYALRFLLIFVVFFLIILLYSEKLIAFAAGFSAVIPVFGAEAAAALVRAKSLKP
ncbi:MAG: ATP synthase subunit I [Candidatus Aminicenantes bacterium]|nr:ATP synthase subunit I [Candidatus Aminicenantes bacterium]